MLTGTYNDTDKSKRTWEDFVSEYEAEVFPRFGEENRAIMAHSMRKFAALVNPKRFQGITTKDVDSYIWIEFAKIQDQAKVKPA